MFPSDKSIHSSNNNILKPWQPSDAFLQPTNDFTTNLLCTIDYFADILISSNEDNKYKKVSDAPQRPFDFGLTKEDSLCYLSAPNHKKQELNPIRQQFLDAEEKMWQEYKHEQGIPASLSPSFYAEYYSNYHPHIQIEQQDQSIHDHQFNANPNVEEQQALLDEEAMEEINNQIQEQEQEYENQNQLHIDINEEYFLNNNPISELHAEAQQAAQQENPEEAADHPPLNEEGIPIDAPLREPEMPRLNAMDSFIDIDHIDHIDHDEPDINLN